MKKSRQIKRRNKRTSFDLFLSCSSYSYSLFVLHHLCLSLHVSSILDFTPILSFFLCLCSGFSKSRTEATGWPVTRLLLSTGLQSSYFQNVIGLTTYPSYKTIFHRNITFLCIFFHCMIVPPFHVPFYFTIFFSTCTMSQKISRKMEPF